MEIISYSDKKDYRKKNVFWKYSENSSASRKSGLSRRHRGKKGASFFARGNISAVRARPVFSFRSFLQNVPGYIHYACVRAQRFVSYMWILPALVVLVLVPSTVSRILSYSESFARAVRFESTADLSIAYLENAMNDFAVDRNGYYDKDGNVIGSDAVKNFKQPVTYSNYTVRAGDTISGISRRFGLSNISTLIAVNGISNVRSLRTGQKLKVPSMDGLVHEVTKGESLGSISRRYGASVADILDVNDLSSEVIQAGDRLFIPGARLDSESLQKAMGELFSYPIKSSWRLTSRFGRRADPFTGVSSNHTGVDMACPTGTSIYSAMSGTVAYTGYSSVFGNYAIIKHADGYQTLYGHMSKILCKKGQRVTQGSVIGLVGSTGYSTGPHLHFTVYKNGKLVDPLTVLK